MPIRPVLRLPDPILQERAAEVDDVRDPLVQQLCVDLVDTMRASPACVGLAANQIGVGLRVFAVDITGHRKARSCAGEVVLVNPVLVEAHDPEPAREGCMSVPDLTGDVARATRLHPRQIGWLVAANHLAILIPCHRVVGKDGALVGYGGGLARKRWLLDHELRTAGVVLR